MVQYREGDVVIGVLASVHNRGQGTATCNRILGDGIEEIEITNLLIDRVRYIRIIYLPYCKIYEAKYFKYFWHNLYCTVFMTETL